MTETSKSARAKSAARRRSAIRLAVICSVAVTAALLLGPIVVTRDSSVRNWLSSAVVTAPTPLPGFEDVVERVKPAVFGIRTKVIDGDPADGQGFLPGLGEEFGNRPSEESSEQRDKEIPRPITNQGSGFFISSDGYAITTNHVVEHGASIEIETYDGKKYPATVVGSDPESDLALIKVQDGGFSFVEIADQPPRIGEWVIAVGNPFGLGGTVTAGIVSARARDISPGSYSEFIQIDAPVNQGNSGGPTFDATGKVLGVNSAIVSPTGGSVGIGFAIPAETVKAVAAELKEKGRVVRAWIGVQIQDITPEIAEGLSLQETQGALVSQPQPNSPAARGGILAGDVITSLNGEPLKDDRDLAKKVGSMAPGTQVELGVVRRGKTTSVAITLGQLPDRSSTPLPEKGEVPEGSTDPASLGLTLIPGESLQSGAEGVIVTEVEPDGIAAERGFQPGDVILDVGGSSVSAPSDVQKALSEAQSKNKRNAVARVKTGTATRFLAIPVG